MAAARWPPAISYHLVVMVLGSVQRVEPWRTFILKANIAPYKEMLADAQKITMLRKLLVEEEAKLNAWHNARLKAAE